MPCPSNIQVSVASCASAEVFWGPRPVRRAETVGWLRRRLATSLECELDVVKLLHATRQLDDAEPISSLLDMPEQELLLTFVRGGEGAGAGADAVLHRLERGGAERYAQGKGGIVVQEDPCDTLSRERIAEILADAARLCDCELLPLGLSSWLEVLMSSGKILKIACNSGYGLSLTTWWASWAEAKHQPGLFCLSARWFCDQAYKVRIVYFIDLTGSLSKIDPEEWLKCKQKNSSSEGLPSESDGCGCVWLAQWTDSAWNNNFQDELQLAFGPGAIPTLDMIRQMKDGSMPVPGIPLGMLSCIAPSVSHFFRELSYSGTIPA